MNYLRNSHTPTRGFTIIEFVIVILIAGVLSAVVFARFFDNQQFNGIILRDRIIAAARAAQQSALGRADVVLTITPNAGATQVTVNLSEVGGTIQSLVVDSRGVTLSGDVDVTSSCGTVAGTNAITNANPMTLEFGELGDLETSGVTGSTAVPTTSVRICINDSATESVCVSPSGFAYGGDCDV